MTTAHARPSSVAELSLGPKFTMELIDFAGFKPNL
jgi:hypothetical protein